MLLSSSIASLIPGLIALFIGNITEDALGNLILFLIFYLVYFIIILAVGFPTIILSLKFKFGPLIIPPTVGALLGFMIPLFLYHNQTETIAYIYPILIGTLTATCASSIYFYQK